MSITTSPNLFPGKSRKDIIGAAIYGGSTITAGLWHTAETMLSKYIYHTISINDTFSTADNFCGAPTASTSTMSDIAVTLERFIVDKTLCKEDFNGTFQEDNAQPAVAKYIEDLLSVSRRSLEQVRWSGDTTSGNPVLAKQNGVVRQLVLGGAFIPVAGALAANILDPTKVIAELNKALAVVPEDVRYGGAFKIIMAPKVYAAYQQAAWADGNFNAGLTGLNSFATNQDPAEGVVGSFMGHPIYIAVGLNAVVANQHIVLMGAFGDANGRNSNLILATDMLSDDRTIEYVDMKPRTNRETWEVQFDYRQGIGVANQNQIVMYI